MTDACANTACEPKARGRYLQHCKEYFAVLRRILGPVPFGFGKHYRAIRNPSTSNAFLVELLSELHKHCRRTGSLRIVTLEGQQVEREVDECPPKVLSTDLEVPPLPADDNRRAWSFYHFCRSAPATFILSSRRPVEVYQVALVELELFGRESGLGSQRAF